MGRYYDLDHQLEISDVCEWNGNRFFFDVISQTIYSFSLSTGIVHLEKKVEFETGMLGFRLFVFGDAIFIFDKVSIRVAKFCCIDKKISEIGSAEAFDFSDFIRFGNLVYMIPLHMQNDIYCFNLESEVFSRICLCGDEVEKEDECAYIQKYGGEIYAPVVGKNRIYIFSVAEKFSCKKIILQDHLDICSCALRNGELFMTVTDSSSLYKLCKNGCVEELYKGCKFDRPFSYLYCFHDKVLALPGRDGKLVIYDLKSDNMTLYSVEGDGRSGARSLGLYTEDTSIIYVLPYRMKNMICVNLYTKKIADYALKYDRIDVLKEYSKMQGEIFYESEEMDLDVFIAYAANNSIN